jgi:uncharacterized membrane protein
MTTANWLKLYFLTVPVFFAVDLFWLGFLAKDFYHDRLAPWLSPSLNWPAAILFYLLFIVGILYFAVAPALAQGSLGRAVTNGLLFGFFTYMTYELTNLATLSHWPMQVVLIDTGWGMALCAGVAALSYLVGRWLQGV